MKKFLLVIPVFALVLLGIGCSQTETEESSFAEATEDRPEVTEEVLEAGEEEKIDEESTMEQTYAFPGILSDEEIMNKQIRLSTDKGDIVFELYAETAPKTVSNFVYLTGEEYYNGLTFHRREEGFVIQGGDPSGNGTGGPGYTFEDELDDDYTYEKGVLAMANRGPDTNGSQFFIMLSDYPLPHLYTIFGKVTEGIEIVDEIAIGDVMTTVTVEDKE